MILISFFINYDFDLNFNFYLRKNKVFVNLKLII